MKICTWNAAGIRNKRDELELFLDSNDVSILLVCETFLKPQLSFSLSGFKCFRKDREEKIGGSVAIFYRTNILASEIHFDTNIEAVGLRTTINNHPRTFVAAYNPPANKISSEDLAVILQDPGTILGGDLNAKHPSWGSRLANPSGLP